MKLPATFAPIVFGFLLTCVMSGVVSGIATWNAIGFVPHFTAQWIESWLFAWAVAFPTVLFVAPIARRITGLVVAEAVP